jgi:hypothetical protein
MRKISLIGFLVLIFSVILYFCLTSCRSVKKTTSSTETISDTSHVKKSSSGQKTQNDSAGSTEINTGTATSTNKTTGDQITANFGKDTGGAKTPVKITWKEDGSVEVDPGGRQLNNLQVKKKKTEQKKDSTGTREKTTAITGNADSTWKNASDSSGAKKKIVATNSSTSRMLPWWSWVLIGGGVCGVIWLIRKLA